MYVDRHRFPKYKGLEQLIPGHAYLDEKGVELLFLGRGKYYRAGNSNLETWATPGSECFLYFKTKDLDKKLAEGRLTPDLRTYDPMLPNRPDFGHTVFFSKNPRNLMEDRGERYPAGFFEHLIVEDKSPDYYVFAPMKYPHYTWHIEALNA